MEAKSEYRGVVWCAAALVLGISGLALIGWAFDIAALKSFRTDAKPMRVSTALGLAGGAAALVAARRRGAFPAGTHLCGVLGGCLGLLGLWSMLFYLSEPAWLAGSLIGGFFSGDARMAVLTAFSFVGIGAAFPLLCSPGSRGAAVGHAIVLPVAAVNYLALISYVFDVKELRTLLGIEAALNTSVACCILCAGMFLLRPDSWFMRVVTGPDAGGVIARRMLPAALLVPLLMGLVRFGAESAGILTEPLAVAINVISNGFILLWIIWLTARSVSATDARRREIEAALRESEQRYRNLVETSPDAILVNRDNRIVQVNRAATALLGAAGPEQVLGKGAMDLFHPDYHGKIRERIESVLAGEAVPPLEEKIVRLDGAIRDVEAVASPFLEGRTPAVQVILRDITGRKRAEEELRWQREWLRVTLTSIGDAVLACDTRGDITFLNPVAAALTGWTEDEALGRPIQQIFRIINEETGEPAEDIAGRVLREGTVVMLANHTAVVRRDGGQVPIEDSAAPITGRDGKVAGVVLVFHDVTEKRRAQEALRRSEQRVRLKLESILSPEGNVEALELEDIIDSGALQSLMEDFYELARIPMAIIDIKGKVLVGVGWQDVCTKFHRVNAESCRHCIESDTELSAGIAQGEFKLYKCRNHMWDMATPLMIGGQHVGNLFTGQFFFEGEAPDRELFRLQAAHYGFEEGEYLAALDRVPRLSRDSVSRAMDFLVKLGHMLSLLSFSNIKLARSLAERNQLMDSLREGQDRLSRAQEIAHLGSWELDVATGHLMWSDEVYRIFGLEPQEFKASYEAFLDALHPEDRAAVDAAYSGSLREGKSSYQTEHRVLRKATGEVRWVQEKCEHIRDGAGAIVRSVGMVLDITDRKRAEEALTRSEALYRAIARNLPDGSVYLVDAEMRFLVAEGSLMAGIGQAREALEGRTVREALGRQGFRVVEERYRRALAGEPASYEGEYAGHSVWSHYVPLRDESGAVVGAISLWLDITERKRVEEQLRHAQKLESIGLLAGGIAHDFNNLLVGVIGNASLAEDMLPKGDPTREVLARIVQSGEQAAHLTRQMLAYAGKGRFLSEPVNLNGLFEQSRALVQSSISKKIGFRLELQPDLPAVETDPSQMQQVFMNLVLNAGEAIGDDAGVIEITTGEMEIDAGWIREELAEWALEPGPHVFLEVSDSGPGMDAHTQARIFDPFFTTKFQGRGLGLAAVAGIVRAHHGAIKVTTAPGAGATFRVLLPAMTRAVPAAQTAPPRLDGDLRGEGTLLFVDDEQIIRDLARCSLERQGYEVLVAEDGAAAIEAVRSADGRIRLAILDLSMPGMGGEETLPHLRKLQPDLEVIVSSGYSEAETLELFCGARLSGFIQKPYTAQTLAREIKAVLGKESAAAQ